MKDERPVFDGGIIGAVPLPSIVTGLDLYGFTGPEERIEAVKILRALDNEFIARASAPDPDKTTDHEIEEGKA